ERTSERERLYIETHYYDLVLQDKAQGIQTYEIWTKAYPRDDLPHNNLGVLYAELGQHEKALREAQESVRLDPINMLGMEIVGFAFLALNRFDEAKIAFGQALSHRPDGLVTHIGIYVTAAVVGDNAAMQQQVAWVSGRPEAEGTFFVL